MSCSVQIIPFGCACLLTLHQQLHLDSNLTSVLYKLFTYLLKQYSKTQPEVIPKFSCDVSLANGELRQACGHVMLSSWQKRRSHAVGKLYAPPSLFMQLGSIQITFRINITWPQASQLNLGITSGCVSEYCFSIWITNLMNVFKYLLTYLTSCDDYTLLQLIRYNKPVLLAAHGWLVLSRQ